MPVGKAPLVGINLANCAHQKDGQPKTIAQLIDAISSAGFWFERRRYCLPELQEIATIWKIILLVKERKLVEGWVG
jgi:hypothetical protein